MMLPEQNAILKYEGFEQQRVYRIVSLIPQIVSYFHHSSPIWVVVAFFSLIYLRKPNKLTRILLILVFALTYVHGYAQPYYFKHYQVENGLSNNTVYASI